MVVLAASILTKSGKVLLSRHFVEMHRVRIEGLLAAFPKLIGAGPKQHTFVETESVRYVYQPLDTLYLLVVTNKSSNIIEDLETLRLLAKLIPEYCASVDEDGIEAAQFSLVFAIDEAIALGYRENVKPDQIRTYTEMDSNEERLFLMIQQHKIDEARKDAVNKAHELAGQRKQRGSSQIGTANIAQSIDRGVAPPQTGGLDGFSTPVSRPEPSHRATGMTLGVGSGQSKTSSFLNALKSEGELKDEVLPFKPAQPTSVAQASGQSVHVSIEEKVNVKLTREGGLQSVEVLGNLSLLIKDPQLAHVALQCTQMNASQFQSKVNPKINKESFNSAGLLELTDPSRGYAIGNPLVILKWRMPPCTDESLVPLMVNCWPSEIDGGFSINLDYELNTPNLVLSNVCISVPLLGFGVPTVLQVDGETDITEQGLNWLIPEISEASSTGTLEFEVRGNTSSDSLFPISVAFQCAEPYSGLKLLGVRDTQSSSEIPHSTSVAVTADEYLIV